MSTSTPSLTAAGTPYDPRAAEAVLAILAIMALMVTYVETMVLPAFKQFITFFNGPSDTTVAWILSAYLLVGTVAVPIFGKLGDKYGKKRILLLVMGVYAAAVSVAGFTPDIGNALGVARSNQIYLLIGVRAVQGIGMAMFPLAFAMIPEVFPAVRVGQAQGIVSAMFAGGAALGLAGGGYVAQQYGWQFTYHTVIPVAVVLVVLAALRLRESVHREPNPIDLPGVASLGFVLAALMLGITESSNWGWTNLSAVSFAGVGWGVPEFLLLSVAGLAFFLAWEMYTDHPLVSFAALRQRNVWISNVNGLFVGAGMFLVFVAVTVLTESPVSPGFNLSEFQFGLVALPSALSMLAVGPFLGRSVSRFGPKPVMILGFGLMAVGALSLAFFHATVLEVILGMIPTMMGNVGVLIAMSNVIVLSVAPRELGVQTGMNQTFRNLGSAVGPVVATTIISSYLTTLLVPTSHGTQPVSVFANTGFLLVFAFTAAVAVAGLVLSLGLRNFRYSSEGIRTDERLARPSASAPVPAERPAASVPPDS
jgi:MFS family permease